MAGETWLTLSGLTRRLRSVHGDLTPSYQALWRAAAEGRFPAEQLGGRWRVSEQDIALVEAALGLVPRRLAGAQAPATGATALQAA